MSLGRGTNAEVPIDAIVLSRDEAVEYQHNFLKNWTPRRDVYPFLYGTAALPTATAFAGIYINNYFRLMMHLHTIGRFTTYLPIACVPAMFSLLLHVEGVIPHVLLQDACPICTELRSAGLQMFSGAIFPLLLAPTAVFSLAMQCGTYDVPYITKEPRKVWELFKKITKPARRVFGGIILGQALLGAMVTHFQARSLIKVQSKMIAMETEYEMETICKENSSNFS